MCHRQYMQFALDNPVSLTSDLLTSGPAMEYISTNFNAVSAGRLLQSTDAESRMQLSTPTLSMPCVDNYTSAHGSGRRYYILLLKFLSFSSFWPTVLSVEPLARCVVCRLSVTFCIVAKRYVLAKKCLKE